MTVLRTKLHFLLTTAQGLPPLAARHGAPGQKGRPQERHGCRGTATSTRAWCCAVLWLPLISPATMSTGITPYLLQCPLELHHTCCNVHWNYTLPVAMSTGITFWQLKHCSSVSGPGMLRRCMPTIAGAHMAISWRAGLCVPQGL